MAARLMIEAVQELTVEETKQLAIQLGVKSNILDGITKYYHDVKTFTIYACLDNDPEISLERIVNSLKEIGMNTKAERIAERYFKQKQPTIADGGLAFHPEQQVHILPRKTHATHAHKSASVNMPSIIDPKEPPLLGVVEVEATILKLTQEYSLVLKSTQLDLYTKEKKDRSFPQYFQEYLMCLPTNVRAVHEPFLRQNEDEIIDAIDTEEIFSILAKYCNYTNYELLLCIANKFCDISTKERMHNYHASFEEFEKATNVDIYLDAIHADENIEMALTYMAMNLKKRPSKCTLHDLRIQKREFDTERFHFGILDLQHQSNWIWVR